MLSHSDKLRKAPSLFVGNTWLLPTTENSQRHQKYFDQNLISRQSPSSCLVHEDHKTSNLHFTENFKKCFFGDHCFSVLPGYEKGVVCAFPIGRMDSFGSKRSDPSCQKVSFGNNSIIQTTRGTAKCKESIPGVVKIVKYDFSGLRPGESIKIKTTVEGVEFGVTCFEKLLEFVANWKSCVFPD